MWTQIRKTEEPSESDKGSRTNPYDLGETAEFIVTDYDEQNNLEGTATVTIDNVIRGEEALNQINENAAGTHEQVDDQGLEYILFEYEYELVDFVDDDTDYTFSTNFSMYNDNGEHVQSTVASGVGDRSGNTVFQGGSTGDEHAQSAPSEGEFLIKIPDTQEDVFFEVK